MHVQAKQALLAVAGILVSLYAYRVESRVHQGLGGEVRACVCVCVSSPRHAHTFNPTAPQELCDLHESISCSKVLGSTYGRGLGIVPRMWRSRFFFSLCAQDLLNRYSARITS